MDPQQNPFSPGAGNPPPELAGRRQILETAMLALARVKNGRAEKSLLMVGLRGVGKTVLLNEVQRQAEKLLYKVIYVEIHEGRQKKTLAELLLPHLRRILFDLDRGERISAQAKRAIRVLKSFMNGLKLKMHDVEFYLDYDAETGAADSGDIEVDLAELFLAIGEAAKDRQTAVAIILDEMQYLDEKELSAIIMAVHRIAQKSLPLIIIGAGLPQLVGKAGNSKSYAERLFTYPDIGALNEEDAAEALQKPVKSMGVEFTQEALAEIYAATHGYAYFLQEWGKHAWLVAAQSPITVEDVKIATQKAIATLDKDFFRVRFDRLTPTEKNYVRALAELGAKPQRSGDIAEIMKKQVNQVAPLRGALIKKGMIYSPAHGDTAFTVPLFEEFLKRQIPKI